MGLIDDVIDRALHEGLVLGVSQDSDTFDVFRIRARSDSPVLVWIRPDGRFSRARLHGRLITLGQVVDQLDVRATAPSRRRC